VERATIERILELAQRTPSWCNAQPWKAHIASGAATGRLRAALLAYVTANKPDPDYAFPREYRGVYLARRRECGFQLYDAVGVARGDRVASARQAMENYRLFGAPNAMIVSCDEALGVYGVLDCGAWLNNFMLAASSLGVACIAQAALATHPRPLREFFGIGEDRRIVCGMSFGYEDPQHPANRFRTRRAGRAEVATWIDA
jgi:nitroreductase